MVSGITSIGAFADRNPVGLLYVKIVNKFCISAFIHSYILMNNIYKKYVKAHAFVVPIMGVTVRDDIGVMQGVFGSIRASTYLTGNIPRRSPSRPSNQFSSTLRISFTRSPWTRTM